MSDYAIVRHYRFMTGVAASAVYGFGLLWFNESSKSIYLSVSFFTSVLLVMSLLVLTEKLLKAKTEEDAAALSETNYKDKSQMTFIVLAVITFLGFLGYLLE